MLEACAARLSWARLCLAGQPLAWQARAYELTIALSWLVLLAATWRLWTPQAAFPQVPLFSAGRTAPVASEWLAAAALVAALASQFVVAAPLARRGLWCASMLAASWLIIVDQNRAQAWVLQLLWASLVLVLLPRERWPWLRFLALSLYFWSAVSKLQAAFFHGLGLQLAAALFAPWGLDLRSWPEALQTILVAAMPVGELLAAGALAFPATRRAGLILATLLHLGLLAALGPWGLRHSAGVLLWNLSFLAQVWLLFGWQDVAVTASVERPPVGVLLRLARAAIVFLGLWPAGELGGWCDPWPAWALYSGRTERIDLLIASDADLPPDLLLYLASSAAPDRVRLRLDDWSLGELGVPLYPDQRVQLGVALGVAQRYDPHTEVYLISPAHPWTGARTSLHLAGVVALQQQAAHYWFNALPRENLAR